MGPSPLWLVSLWQGEIGHRHAWREDWVIDDTGRRWPSTSQWEASGEVNPNLDLGLEEINFCCLEPPQYVVYDMAALGNTYNHLGKHQFWDNSSYANICFATFQASNPAAFLFPAEGIHKIPAWPGPNWNCSLCAKVVFTLCRNLCHDN